MPLEFIIYPALDMVGLSELKQLPTAMNVGETFSFENVEIVWVQWDNQTIINQGFGKEFNPQNAGNYSLSTNPPFPFKSQRSECIVK